jgi:protein SDA1
VFQAKKEARLALVRHGIRKGDTKSVTMKLPSSDELSMKRVDPTLLEVPITPTQPYYTKLQTLDLCKIFIQAHIKRNMSKEERLKLVKAGREDRGKYQARTAIKNKKVTQ